MKNKILTLGVSVLVVVVAVCIAKFIKAASTGDLLPVADGPYRQWVPNVFPLPPTTTPHYKFIDEALCNGDEDYLYTNTLHSSESYSFDIFSIPNNATINSITVFPCASVNVVASTSTTSTPTTSTFRVLYMWNGILNSERIDFVLPNTNNIPVDLEKGMFSNLSLIKQADSRLDIGLEFWQGSAGMRLSQMMISVDFTPPPPPPTVSTGASTQVKKFSATLNGSANPNGEVTTGWFRYSTVSPGACNDLFGIRVPDFGGIALSFGNNFVPYSRGVSGLSSGTTYFYCAIASNLNGLGFGEVKSFFTLPSVWF